MFGDLYIIIYVLEILLLAALLYGLYKVIWYAVKMLAFASFMRNLTKDGVTVQRKRGLFGMVFGQKGAVDYIVEHEGKKYEVSVLSFPSSHGRWNIEKTRTRFFIESRRASKFFYKKRSNSGEPDHVEEYKNEGRLSRKELYITPIDKSFERQIFLLYPYPKRMTYTDVKYNVLYVGDEVEGHVIMDAQALDDMLFGEKHSSK